MKKLWQLFKRKEEDEKQLEAIQVEVSASCNTRCTFCPTSKLKYPGPDMMDLELFRKLVPYFSMSKWVYLQGWGEPLLNKDFWQMVELVKGTGVKVGFTTNGTLLDQENIKSVFTCGIDLISVSIAGATEENHGRLRSGSSLQTIGENVGNLIKERKARGLDWPKVNVSYMLTKDSIPELEDALKLAMGWGVDEFYTTHLDYIIDMESDEKKIFCAKDTEVSDPKELQEQLSSYQGYIDKAITHSTNERFPFRFCKLEMKEQGASCELNPSKFLFITASGDVTPCTYLGRIENPKIFCGQTYSFPRQVFGNIEELELGEILSAKEYREFSEPFKQREEALAKLLYIYGDCEPSLIRIQEAEDEYRKVMEKYPLPKPCQVCPKPYDI